ncbi:MAG: transposase [Flavobacterium sp.]|nr:transposase [Flavobacterium sp.]
MQHITGISRQQMRFSSLEDTISADNQVRFIDAFFEYIDLSKLNFAVKTLKTEGRPSFNSKVFLKIYLYGYLNGVRSGRDLEKECLRNMEMQWLLEDIRPNYQSIKDFRKITQSHQRTLSNYLFRY